MEGYSEKKAICEGAVKESDRGSNHERTYEEASIESQ
jgi:hypothetical protein